MNQVYDAIVCGTGLSECILSGLLSTSKKRVLHLDRNPYYGGESASLNLTNLFKMFPAGGETNRRALGPHKREPESWGMNRDWNVDLIPKFIMANGKLVKILLKTGVKDYLEFQIVEGSYVYQHQKAGWWPTNTERFIHKVPATESEALTSGLVGLTEKLRAKSFFAFIANFQETNPASWLPKGPHGELRDPHKTTMAACYEHFGVSSSIIDFVGHAIALHTSDDYLKQPMALTMNKLKLYLHSLLRYGSSPFIYPMYGLGTLPEGFSRLSAVYGGIYMLNTPVKNFIIDEKTGRFRGVQTIDGQIALAENLICDPSYCLGDQPSGPYEPNKYTEESTGEPLAVPAGCKLVSSMPRKVRKVGQVIRVINILNAPVPGTNQRKSCQIILPQAQLGRKTDIYVAVISATHGICVEGKFVVLVSGTVETTNPLKGEHTRVRERIFAELSPAFDLLGPIEQQFVAISDLYEAVDDGTKDGVFVSNSYDAQSHFESATENVLEIWRHITGSELELEPVER